MKIAGVTAVAVCALLLAPIRSAAQSYEQSIEESTREMEKSMDAMAEFVKDVSFNEKDIKSVIANWREFGALGDEFDDGGTVEGADEEETVDFEELLTYPAYRSWAKSKGLDPDTWLKKFMRIQTMLMKEVSSEGMAQGSGLIREQLAELEAQRDQLGEDVYRQMKAAMEAGAAAMGTVNTAYDKLPDPTPAEKKLLERYGEQLKNLE